jgi:DNA-binding FadR family transcriptional regulator
MIKKIVRVPLQSEIIKFIQDYIKDEGLAAGDKLPSQAELLNMIGVSRTSLREAIKTLEAKNVIEVQNGKGIYVRDNNSNAMITYLNFVEEKETLLETVEARKILEREILKLVIRNITDEELKNLGETVKILMDKYHRGEKQNEEDRKFHYMIYEYSHNRIMYQMILSISNYMNKLWEFPLNMDDPFTETIPLHEDLYKAICRKDIKKAQEINEQIINSIYTDIDNQE